MVQSAAISVKGNHRKLYGGGHASRDAMSVHAPCKAFQKQAVFSFLSLLRKDNCRDCQNALRTIQLESKARFVVKKGFWVLFGAVVSPFVLSLIATFWPYWPASHVDVSTSGIRPLRGNATGCLVYRVIIGTDRGFDDAHLKIRFPMRVSDTIAGSLSSENLSTENGLAMAVEDIGKDPSGECKIFKTTVDESEVTAKIIQRAVVIHLGKTQAKAIATAVVVGSDERELGKSISPVVHEGYFDSPLLAYPAKRYISFHDSPIQDAN